MPETPARAGRALEELARTMRGAVGSLRAAAETLENFPDLEGAPRQRLLAIVAQESERLGDLICRIEKVAQTLTAGASARNGGALTVADLVERLSRRAAELGFELAAEAPLEPALARTNVALPGEEAIGAAADFLAGLRREMAVSRLQVTARSADRQLLVDLRWNPEPADLARLLDWQSEALDAPPAAPLGGAPLGAHRGLRPLARDHDGEAWFNLDRDGAVAHVKLLLPLETPAAG
jgi:DNA polymerase-3 subunit epsilon